jgi:hypothetical protein
MALRRPRVRTPPGPPKNRSNFGRFLFIPTTSGPILRRKPHLPSGTDGLTVKQNVRSGRGIGEYTFPVPSYGFVEEGVDSGSPLPWNGKDNRI